MASWTKTVGSLASALTCAAGGSFYSPATTTQLTALAGQLSSTVAVSGGGSIQVSGSIQNTTSPPTTGATVVLLSSSDGGTTWWMIGRASGGITAGTSGSLGTLTAAGNYPFSFNLVPDGNALLALYVYGNVANSVALWGEVFYGSSFS